jgi:hypothetical protein
MPTIPTFTSSVPIGAPPAPVQMNPTAAGAAEGAAAQSNAQLASAFARLGGQFEQVADQERRQREANEATALDVTAAQRLEEARITAAQDTSPGAAERFQARALEIRGEIASEAGSDRVRGAVMRDFDRRALGSWVEVRRGEAGRVQDRSRATIDEALSGHARLAAESPNDAVRSTHIAAARAAIARGVAEGVIPATQAGNLERGFLGRVDEARALALINTNPAEAERALADPRQFPNMDPVRRERLYAQSASRADRGANQDRQSEERSQRENARQAELDFNDAFRSGDVERTREALGRMRQHSAAGEYASAADRFYGARDIPTTPQMQSWIETRLRDRAAPLTRNELEDARAGRRVSEQVYRDGLSRLSAREDARFREAEDFVRLQLNVPPATIPDRDLQPYQRTARDQNNRIIADLMIERQRNPDVDAFAYVRDRLSQRENPATLVQREQANAGLARLPTSIRTPEGLDRLEEQLAAHEAYRALGWFARQGATTVEPPTVVIGGRPTVVTRPQIERWQTLQRQAGIRP